MRESQIVDLEITDLSYEAIGVAHLDGITVFVNNALPGGIVSARILEVKKNFAFAKIEKIKKESLDRIDVEFRQWVQTGLTSLAHIKYGKQLEFKHNQVVNSLHKADLDKIKVSQTLPSPEETGYHNKAQVPVRKVHDELNIGFFRKHSHDLVPLTNFFTTDPEIGRVLIKIRDILGKNHIPVYDEIHNKGEVRYLDVRRLKAIGEIMAILVCLHKDFPQLKKVAKETDGTKGVISVVLNHNPRKTSVILGKKDYLLWSEPQITDKIGDVSFKISPQGFFQINSLQTPRLHDLAIQKADLKPDDIIIDAYSGIGTIGLLVAKHVKAVRGMEVIKPAVDDANANAKLNGIMNVEYVVGKAEEVTPRWAKKGSKTDVIFVDPPRKGLTPEFVDTAVETDPKRTVHISCDPATMVRGLQLFREQGCDFNEIDPVDVFPQTPHVEAVTMLERK